MPESSSGNNYLLTLIDLQSKWAEAVPIKDKYATTVAKVVYKTFLDRGFPQVLSSDQGCEFVNDLTEELMKLNGVEKRVSSAYHPQSQGLVERFNQTLQRMLLKMIGDGSQSTWDSFLDEALYSYRCVPQGSTKISPFQLMYGRKPFCPNGISLDDLGNVRAKLEEKAKANVLVAQNKQKRLYDKRHTNTGSVLCIGDKVLLQNSRKISRKGSKMQSAWMGPYEIAEILPKNRAKLLNLKTKTLLVKVVSTHLLKKYVDREESQSQETAVSNEADESSDEVKFEKVVQLPELQFFPIDAKWQTEVAPTLGLSISKRHMPRGDAIALGRPVACVDVRGDGNCFFRCISYCVTGTEDQHRPIRCTVARHMQAVVDKQLQTYRSRNASHYFDDSGVEMNAVWATDAEILAMSHVLRTNIYVFTSAGSPKDDVRFSWLKFDPATIVGNGAAYHRGIYLNHLNLDHYQVVTKVEENQESGESDGSVVM